MGSSKIAASCDMKSHREEHDLDKLLAEIRTRPIPDHVAIIMDGNGRWASQRGLPRAAGHRAGVESLREIVKASSELGIKYLTLYCFSTENWKRPKQEVEALMQLLVEYVDRELEELIKNNVRVLTIGHLEELPPYARLSVEFAMCRTQQNTGMKMILALNYGGRREIVDVARKLAREAASGSLDPESIDESTFASRLQTAGIPDPDLLIRPSGELRISNFLLWQLAYTEFWTTEVLWPDFGRAEFYTAIRDYQRRQRRFGGIREDDNV